MKLVKDLDLSKIVNFPKDQPKAQVYQNGNCAIYTVAVRDSWWTGKAGRNKYTTIGRIRQNVYYPVEEYDLRFTQRGNPRLAEETARLKKAKQKKESSSHVSSCSMKECRSEVKRVDAFPIFYEVSKQIGIVEDLKACFPMDQVNALLALSFFLLTEGSFVARKFERWSVNRRLPFTDTLKDQQISDLLFNLGSQEESINNYFAKRFARYSSERYFSYDSTNFACDSTNITYSAIGCGKHGEIRNQVGLAIIYGQQSHQPMSFRLIKGNINDQQTMRELIDRCEELNKKHHDWCCHITDRGYFSLGNLALAKESNLRFLIAAKTNAAFIVEKVERYRDKMIEAQNYINGSGNNYGRTFRHEFKIDGKSYKVWLHLYLSLARKQEEVAKFNDALDRYERLRKQESVKIKAEALSDSDNKRYSKYFIFSEDDSRQLLGRNYEAIDDKTKSMGFYANVTTWNTDATTAWQIYSGRDCIEKCFKFGKSELDVDTVRVHSNESCEGRFLVHFIALQIQNEIKLRMNWQSTKEFKNGNKRIYGSLKDQRISYSDLISSFNGTRQQSYSNGKISYDEITKDQSIWLKTLKIEDAYKLNQQLYEDLAK
ncbi:MAG: transposase [Lachnospiraceae bacterium]|nr:transposase [Lachnospiraceae bacterium]